MGYNINHYLFSLFIQCNFRRCLKYFYLCSRSFAWVGGRLYVEKFYVVFLEMSGDISGREGIIVELRLFV